MPNEVGIAVVAIVVIVVIALVSRRWRGDRPGDRGPFSTAMDVRGDFAAMGRTLDERPKSEAEGEDSEHQPR